MAEHPLLTDLLGEALLRLAGRISQVMPAAARMLESLRERAEPRPGIVLYAADGAIYTGLVLVDRNQPVAMLVFRHEGSKQPDRSPDVTPSARRLFHEPSSYGRDEGPWREGDDVPFWRR